MVAAEAGREAQIRRAAITVVFPMLGSPRGSNRRSARLMQHRHAWTRPI
jgi:hypothetical protein